VLVHGGGWVAGDKQQYISIFPTLVRRRVRVVKHQLSTRAAVQIPADADDVEAAIRFVKVNAAKYNIDPRGSL